MRNLYFKIPAEATFSVCSFANCLDDKSPASAAGDGFFQVLPPTSTLLPQPQNNILSTEDSRLGPSVSHTSYRKRVRRIVNCDSCGFGEYNCDSCWCQCEDENCNGAHPDNQFGTKDADEEDEVGDGNNDEDADDSDKEETL